MKSIIFIFFTVFVVECSSHENIVSVRQVQNDSPAVSYTHLTLPTKLEV